MYLRISALFTVSLSSAHNEQVHSPPREVTYKGTVTAKVYVLRRWTAIPNQSINQNLFSEQ